MLIEHNVPADFLGCTACSVSTHGQRMIWGEGTLYAPFMFILDNPGAREDNIGNPFVCGTRQTLAIAMQMSGIEENDVYVTWILKCRPTKKYEKVTARRICLRHLEYQITHYKPQLLVCLGNVAARSLLGDTADVKEIRGKILRYGENPGITTIAAYHPLAARRRPNLLPLLAVDLSFAKKLLNSERLDKK